MTKPGAQSTNSHRPSELLDTLKRLGFGVAVAVPDSWLGEISCSHRTGADYATRARNS